MLERMSFGAPLFWNIEEGQTKFIKEENKNQKIRRETHHIELLKP